MKGRRVVYMPHETDFLVREAKKLAGEDITRAGRAVAELHRHNRLEKEWPVRTAGSITNKLYRIKEGYEAYPGFHEEPVKFRSNQLVAAKKRQYNKSIKSITNIDSAWANFQQKLNDAKARFEEAKAEAKEELVKSL